MKRIGFIFLILTIFLSSCSLSRQTSQAETTETPIIPTKTLQSTSTFTPEPEATPTLAPTPIGGTKLRIAYYSHNCEAIHTKNCIAIADFFNENIYYRIPLGDTADSITLIWSPDGRYLLYGDRNDNQTKYNVMLYDFVLTQSMLLKSNYALGSAKWSADLKYVAYKAYNSQYENNQLNIFILETGENRTIDGFKESYYWLDDQKSLVEIKTGALYDVESNELTTIPNAYFMNVHTEYDEFIISSKGDNPSKPDEIYFYPYVRDREFLTENGTGVIYDGEFLFAKYDFDKKSRMPTITMHTLFLMGDKVFFSGYAYLYEPHEVNQYEYTGNISDVPFMITEENFLSTKHDYSQRILISPDTKLYLTEQYFYLGKDKGHQTFITVNDMETGEELDTFDFHKLGEETYEIDYVNGRNLAFYWEEE